MDERPPPLRLVCSDELGQLKVVQTADGAQLGTAALAATWGQPDKLQAIDCIDLGSAGGITDAETAVLAVARCSGAIELLSPLTGQQLGSISPAAASSNSTAGSQGKQQQKDAARVRGLHLLWGAAAAGASTDAAATLPAVLSITQGGTARLHTPTLAPEGGSSAWEQRRSWQVPADVCCTAYDPATGRLAVGCQGTELRLFDVASGELVFAFKGGKPNKVGLVDRPWNTAITFLPPPSTSTSTGAAEGSGGGDGSNGNGSSAGAAGSRLLVGTGHHKVRLYDSEAGKRPQMDLAWGEGRITYLALEPDGQRCWVGNGQGQIEVLDLQARRFCGAVKGLAGSVRSLAVHPEVPVLASLGLDRCLRLHSTESRQLLGKLYCKTLPTGLAFCPTDASMLPPPPPQQEQRQGESAARKRRPRQGASGAGHGGADGESNGEEAEEEEEEQQQQQERKQRKRSKQRGEGGGGSSRKRKQRKQEQRRGGGSGSD